MKKQKYEILNIKKNNPDYLAATLDKRKSVVNSVICGLLTGTSLAGLGIMNYTFINGMVEDPSLIATVPVLAILDCIGGFAAIGFGTITSSLIDAAKDDNKKQKEILTDAEEKSKLVMRYKK